MPRACCERPPSHPAQLLAPLGPQLRQMRRQPPRLQLGRPPGQQSPPHPLPRQQPASPQAQPSAALQPAPSPPLPPLPGPSAAAACRAPPAAGLGAPGWLLGGRPATGSPGSPQPGAPAAAAEREGSRRGVQGCTPILGLTSFMWGAQVRQHETRVAVALGAGLRVTAGHSPAGAPLLLLMATHLAVLARERFDHIFGQPDHCGRLPVV